MKYIDCNGKRYVYFDIRNDSFWEATNDGFKDIELDELPKKIRSELLKEMI